MPDSVHLYHTRLQNRASIIIGGEDRFSFLQGLITQDIYLLRTQPLIYSCLLTPQGKLLFDFFIRENDTNDALIIDCEGGERAQSLLKKLSIFKLRSKVTLDLIDDIDVWQIWSNKPWPVDMGYKDPRHDLCGYRTYTPITDDAITDTPFSNWDAHRMHLDIPDGSRDLIPEKSFIHEGQIDVFNGVSYKKGCYMGQELVSRMHHRGLTKKILRHIDMASITDDMDIRSQCPDHHVAMALIRLDKSS